MTEVKKTRVRRPKVRPPFYSTPNNPTPTVKELQIERGYTHYSASSYNYVPTLSPYSELIPIMYLAKMLVERNSTLSSINNYIKSHNSGRLANFDFSQIKSKALSSMMDYTFYNQVSSYRFDKKSRTFLDANIVNYLRYDDKFGIQQTRNISSATDILLSFKSIQHNLVNMRTYNALMSFYSVIMKRTMPTISWDPHIMAVVKPEDYLYQKRHILIHGSIDMSKVIILVNRELDLPGESIGIPTTFKAVYTKQLEPAIKTTSAKIWKVPLEFIKENCFISDKFDVKSKKPADRKAEIEEFLTAFYKSMGVKSDAITYILASQSDITVTVPYGQAPNGVGQWHISTAPTNYTYTDIPSTVTTVSSLSAEEQATLDAALSYSSHPAPVEDEEDEVDERDYEEYDEGGDN